MPSIVYSIKHTPKPWHVDKTLHCYIYDSDGVGIGEVWRGVNGREYEEDEANALLFAASPELQSALGMLLTEALSMNRTLRNMGMGRPEDGAHPDCAIQIARNAMRSASIRT